MKRAIFILGIIVVVAFAAWGVWFFAFSKNIQPNNPSQLGVLLPTTSSTSQNQAQNTTPASVQNVSVPENADVAKDFLGAMQSGDQITLGGTIVVSPYALQIWGDANTGGEALLKSSATGWTLVSLGGGEWNVLALIQEGVPHSIAEQLIAGLGVSSTGPSINIPTGNTLTIGTSQGSVVMNNFYDSADYIDQAQQAVVVQQTSTYVTVYNIADSSFSITVLSMPFETAQQAAEAAFLNTLNISQGDACKLNVHENVPSNVSSQYAGKSLLLSFCKSGGAFSQ